MTPPCADVAASAAELHGTLHAGGMGVDAPAPSDLYYRLAVASCFYVGQLSGGGAAEVLAGEAYRGADTDPLRTCAAQLVQQMNSERLEDVMRIRWGGSGGLRHVRCSSGAASTLSTLLNSALWHARAPSPRSPPLQLPGDGRAL